MYLRFISKLGIKVLLGCYVIIGYLASDIYTKYLIETCLLNAVVLK